MKILKSKMNKLIKILSKVVESASSFRHKFQDNYDYIYLPDGLIARWEFEADEGEDKNSLYSYLLKGDKSRSIARLYFSLKRNGYVYFDLFTVKENSSYDEREIKLNPSRVKFKTSPDQDENKDVEELFNTIKPFLDLWGKKLIAPREKSFKGKF